MATKPSLRAMVAYRVITAMVFAATAAMLFLPAGAHPGL